MRFCPDMLHTSMLQIHCLSERLCFTKTTRIRTPTVTVSTAGMSPWTPFRTDAQIDFSHYFFYSTQMFILMMETAVLEIVQESGLDASL